MLQATLEDRLSALRKTLDQVRQGHLLHFFDQLDDEQKEELLQQIENIDWTRMDRLVQTHVVNKPRFTLPENLEPAPWYPHAAPKGLKDKYRKAHKIGEKLIASGKVAAFTVAGGQGTRLDWDGPKGSFPATAIRKLPLFACLAEYIRKVQHKYKTVIRWYLMTSPINHDDTLAFFEEHGYFGLDPENVVMFPQAMIPAFDMQSGKALLADPGHLALSPDGHGGSLKALHAGGALSDMKEHGIEHISYTQVDNPLVKIVDPLFLGLHAMDDSQMSSKMVPKSSAEEKMGVFCMVDGRLRVIEYSVPPEDWSYERAEDGTLRFGAGSIAVHALRVDFVESLNQAAGGFALPFHRADKKVPYLDLATSKQIDPEQPNAVKLETFVFDALPLCERSTVYETDRAEEFAPIKNADGKGAVDCPATSIRAQTERAARRLSQFGVKIPRGRDGQVDAVIEISHLTAIEAQDLNDADVPEAIEPGTQVLL